SDRSTRHHVKRKRALNQQKAMQHTRNPMCQVGIGALLVLAAMLVQACGGDTPAPAPTVTTTPVAVVATETPAAAAPKSTAEAATPAAGDSGLQFDHHGNPIVPVIYERL